MSDWALYTGSSEPRDVEIPPAPPWRRRSPTAGGANGDAGSVDPNAALFLADDDVKQAVNAALHLRRPLLLTGRAGSGKSSLVESVAFELQLGPVLRWHITSRSTVNDALYQYDAIGRLHAQNLQQEEMTRMEDFLRLGPLGTALVPSTRPRALLIDEIDKSDIDLPNDLLHVFERGEFIIPELVRLSDVRSVELMAEGSTEPVTITEGWVRSTEFPFVVLTSNGERDFPAAFLRRCIRLRMPDLDEQRLADIVTRHLGADAAERCAAEIKSFAARAMSGDPLATDQLMNAVYLLTSSDIPADERDSVLQLVLKRLTSD